MLLVTLTGRARDLGNGKGAACYRGLGTPIPAGADGVGCLPIAPSLRVPTTMSLLTSLVLLVVLRAAALVLAGDTVQLGGSLAQNCKFTVDGHHFDLCRVVQQEKVLSVGVTKPTPPTVTSSWYRISLDGPLARNESKPADMQVGRNCLSTPER